MELNSKPETSLSHLEYIRCANNLERGDPTCMVYVPWAFYLAIWTELCIHTREDEFVFWDWSEGCWRCGALGLLYGICEAESECAWQIFLLRCWRMLVEWLCNWRCIHADYTVKPFIYTAIMSTMRTLPVTYIHRPLSHTSLYSHFPLRNQQTPHNWITISHSKYLISTYFTIHSLLDSIPLYSPQPNPPQGWTQSSEQSLPTHKNTS